MLLRRAIGLIDHIVWCEGNGAAWLSIISIIAVFLSNIGEPPWNGKDFWRLSSVFTARPLNKWHEYLFDIFIEV